VAGEKLRVLAGNASGTEITLDDDFVIGRSAGSDGRLGDDPELSRSHARIARRAGDQLSIEDLDSTNGTFVNGKRITDIQRLTPGDTIKVGTTTLQVLDAAGAAPQATALASTRREAETAAATAPVAAAAAPTTEAPAAPARTAAPPPPRTPYAPPRPAPPRRRRGGGAWIAALLGLIAVAGIVVAIVLVTGGDDDSDGEQAVLSSSEISEQNRNATVIINTSGPAYDELGNSIGVQRGGGTGVVVDARMGLVLTNAHVLAGSSSRQATVAGAEVQAVPLGKAPCEDLAMVQLRPRPSGLRTATLGNAASVRPGDRVTALGFPGAFEADISQRRLQTTEGVVSSGPSPGTISPELPELPALIQHQAPISPGNSGGPLFDETGAVIGINTIGSSGANQNQNGAISIDRARGLMPDLRSGTNLGYVGWDLHPATLDGREFLYVRAADPNSPADRANLAGTGIFAIDDTRVATVSDVCEIVAGKSSGDPLKIAGLNQSGPFVSRTRLR
jgi:S1-C subfamily serine protease